MLAWPVSRCLRPVLVTVDRFGSQRLMRDTRRHMFFWLKMASDLIDRLEIVHSLIRTVACSHRWRFFIVSFNRRRLNESDCLFVIHAFFSKRWFGLVNRSSLIDIRGLSVGFRSQSPRLQCVKLSLLPCSCQQIIVLFLQLNKSLYKRRVLSLLIPSNNRLPGASSFSLRFHSCIRLSSKWQSSRWASLVVTIRLNLHFGN